MLAAKPPKRAKLRHGEYYDLQETLDTLYARSLEGKVFTDLLSLIGCDENIMLAYRNIKRNKGSTTPGIDHATIEEVKALEAESYVARIKEMLSWYVPKPIRRKEIPKDNGKVRPLGIPSIWDRLFQQCILQVLEPICEAKFYERSNGFRPNRSSENAIAQCYALINKSHLHFVVDVDIQGFFDNVDHTKLIQQMWTMGVRDKNLLCIIRKMLKAPIVYPDKHIEYPTKGTPQGGILSPLLSNIVLNELDWWVASNWENIPTKHQYCTTINPNGSSNKGATYRALHNRNLKEMFIVRYADDFKIFCRTRSAADRTFIAVKQWLNDRLKLQISPEKSKVTNLKRQYAEFLGFKIKVVRKRDNYVVRSHVCDKALKRISQELKKQVTAICRPQSGRSEYSEVNRYNLIVMGVQNYYRFATCVSLGFSQIAFELNRVLKNRLGERLKRKGIIKNSSLERRYGRSKQVRYIHETPLLPIAYVQTKVPMWKKKTVNAYTQSGRSEIHKNLGIDTNILHHLMRTRDYGRTIEFVDNRISLYCAQYGKCAVTGRWLEYDEIHCHHKIPKRLGGMDNYQNLTIVHKDIHVLIHATQPQVIANHLQLLNLDSKSLRKANKLREAAGNEQIAASEIMGS